MKFGKCSAIATALLLQSHTGFAQRNDNKKVLADFAAALQSEINHSNGITDAIEIDDGSDKTAEKVKFVVTFSNETKISLKRVSLRGLALGESAFSSLPVVNGEGEATPSAKCLADNINKYGETMELKYAGILGRETVIFFGYPSDHWHAYDFSTGVCYSSALAVE